MTTDPTSDTLSQVGVSPKESSRWQKLARVATSCQIRSYPAHYRASEWVCIGRDAPELSVIVGQFAEELYDNVVLFSQDWRAIYDYTRLDDEVKQRLIASGETIDRKAIKALRTADIMDERARNSTRYQNGTAGK